VIKVISFIFILFSFTLSAQIITLTTTSKSPAWSPNNVVKTGKPLIWKASATGMTDQIISTIGSPTFDLSVYRESPVTITVTSTDGTSGLTELGLNSLNITSLNVANADFLTSLSCASNQLTSLDVTRNIKLIELFCYSNQLVALDLTKNLQLSILACFFNRISVLDFSQNLVLSKLSGSNNLLKDLDLSNNPGLISLECDSNLLENLNVKNGNNTIIEIFKTTGNINLFCIQVDDANYSTVNWKDVDSWTSFNVDCTFTNEAPIANEDKYETLENTTLNIEAIGVLSNDIDPDGDTLSAVLETNVINGSLDLNSDGSFIYTPNQNFYGVDSFSYKANDGEFDSNIANVTIDVTLVNEPPVANDNSYEIQENTTLNVEKSEGVLSNDTDSDGDQLTAFLVTDVNNGQLQLNANGAFSYIPDKDFYGVDSFIYKAFDGIEYSKEANVLITVQAFFDIIVPNAFTPNNDSINDFFKPAYKGMEKVQIGIYDTWGNLIYFEEGTDLNGWDGNIKGKNAENGNYFYTILAFPINENKIEMHGLFTLIK
jgi:gliding motility-associated-like protein